MSEEKNSDGLLARAGIFSMVALWLLGIALFISLPLVAGIGGTVWIFGKDSIQDSLGPWILLWGVGSLLVTFLVTEIVEAKLKKHSSAGKFTIEAASYATSVAVMTLCYSGFFSSWALSLFAAALSHVLMIPFYLLLARLPNGRRRSVAE